MANLRTVLHQLQSICSPAPHELVVMQYRTQYYITVLSLSQLMSSSIPPALKFMQYCTKFNYTYSPQATVQEDYTTYELRLMRYGCCSTAISKQKSKCKDVNSGNLPRFYVRFGNIVFDPVSRTILLLQKNISVEFTWSFNTRTDNYGTCCALNSTEDSVL